MDIPLDVEVFCSDGACGRSTAIIINPVSQEVTHVVVATQEMLHSEYLVPVTLIEESDADRIQLRCRRNTLAAMEPFHKVKFVRLDDLEKADRPPAKIPEAHMTYAWLWPYITSRGDYGTYVNVEQIPHDELAVHRGAHVEATDGRIGQVDEFVINPTYDYAINFNEDGYGVVEKNELKGMIDTTGKVILPLKYETIYCNISKDGYFCGVYPSSEVTSLANARKDYFDADLNLIPLENVKYLMGAKNGNRIAFSNMEGKLGFMDRNYHIVIPPLFAKVKTFSEGFAWVRH